MITMALKEGGYLAGVLLLLLPLPTNAAGSWVGTAPPVRVAMADREVASATMVAPPAVKDGNIESLIWEYRLPPGEVLRARLCHPGGCETLGTFRGHSHALAGVPASTPLHFRFSLAPGQRSVQMVQGLKVIVNYR